MPDELRGLGIATPGEPLPDFAKRTYRTFFGEMIPARKSEKDLGGVDRAAPRHHSLLHPPYALVSEPSSRPSATASIGKGSS